MSRPVMPDDQLTEAEVEAQFHNFSGADWKRAQSLARMFAAGLTGWTGDALLGEAVTKLLSGERRWRRDVHALVTLKTIMHSIASNTRKREKNGPIDPYATVGDGNSAAETSELPLGVIGEEARDPAEIIEGRSQLLFIESLFVDDDDAGMVVMAWAEGMRGKEAAMELGFEMNRYEAARKRVTKKLEPVAALRKSA